MCVVAVTLVAKIIPDITMNQIIHGDFFEELFKIRVNTVDMILTDLPYNITSNSWDVGLDLDKMWELFHHVLKDNGVICLTAVQPFTSRLVLSNVDEFRHEWIWEKNAGSNFANTIREPMKEHESVLVFSKGKWTYNPIKEERADAGKKRVIYDVTRDTKSDNYRDFNKVIKSKVSKLRVPRSIQKFNRERGLHPTQKPTKLFEYLIKTYTNKGDIVLDCCAGSGTTAVACIHTNRNYICIEKEEKYIDVINKRLKEIIK